MNPILLEEDTILTSFSEIKSYLYSLTQYFTLPDEELDYATREFFRKDNYSIYKIFCINPINTELSANIIIIYNHEAFTIHGYRDKIDDKQYKEIFIGLRLFEESDFLNEIHKLTVLSANRALLYNNFYLESIEKHVFTHFPFLVKKYLIQQPLKIFNKLRLDYRHAQLKANNINLIAKEKLKHLTKKIHNLLYLYRVYYKYYNKDLDSYFYIICDVLIFRSYHIIVDIYISPSKIPNIRINCYRLNLLKNLNHFTSSVASSRTLKEFEEQILNTHQLSYEDEHRKIVQFIYESVLKIKYYGTNEYSSLKIPGHYMCQNPIEKYNDLYLYLCQFIADPPGKTRTIHGNEFLNEQLESLKMIDFTDMINIFLTTTYDILEADYYNHPLFRHEKVKILGDNINEQIRKRREKCSI